MPQVVAAPASPAAIEYRVGSGAWSATPPALFDASWVPVPGASTSTVLEIRSNRAAPTIVAAYLTGVGAGSVALLEATSIASGGGSGGSASSGGAGVTVLSLDEVQGACALFTPQVVLRTGQTHTIPIKLSVDAALDTAQAAGIDFELQLSFSDTGPELLANGCPVDPAIVQAFPTSPATRPVSLEASGGAPVADLIALACFAVGMGITAVVLAAVARSSRREAQ